VRSKCVVSSSRRKALFDYKQKGPGVQEREGGTREDGLRQGPEGLRTCVKEKGTMKSPSIKGCQEGSEWLHFWERRETCAPAADGRGRAGLSTAWQAEVKLKDEGPETAFKTSGPRKGVQLIAHGDRSTEKKRRCGQTMGGEGDFGGNYNLCLRLSGVKEKGKKEGEDGGIYMPTCSTRAIFW